MDMDWVFCVQCSVQCWLLLSGYAALYLYMKKDNRVYVVLVVGVVVGVVGGIALLHFTVEAALAKLRMYDNISAAFGEMSSQAIADEMNLPKKAGETVATLPKTAGETKWEYKVKKVLEDGCLVQTIYQGKERSIYFILKNDPKGLAVGEDLTESLAGAACKSVGNRKVKVGFSEEIVIVLEKVSK